MLKISESEKPRISAKFKSSRSDFTYNTAIYEMFNYCDCPGYRRHRKCKHIKTLEKLELDNIQELKIND